MAGMAPPPVAVFGREEFLRTRWRYRPGEHVTILGPTGSGKTTLAHELLDVSANPRLPGVVLVMKPRDATVDRMTRSLGFRKIRSWPPVWNPFLPRKPRGWVLWPRHTFEPEADDNRLYAEFRRAMLDSYKRGNRIIFADEMYGLSAELGLEHEMKALWQRGRSMGTGIWGSSQRPAHIPLWAYSQAEHLLLHHDPDKRSRDRYSEIGGVDPKLVTHVVERLRRHQWLYIRRDGPHMCVVDA